jgi:hypothetical protein
MIERKLLSLLRRSSLSQTLERLDLDYKMATRQTIVHGVSYLVVVKRSTLTLRIIERPTNTFAPSFLSIR